mmetsp:Transcript_29627/g.89146  ORF Transcript_29627/g.89146 Transcript_29627/m.89146 type:complete len:216 (-) Transcript_29627:45-692(-)
MRAAAQIAHCGRWPYLRSSCYSSNRCLPCCWRWYLCACENIRLFDRLLFANSATGPLPSLMDALPACHLPAPVGDDGQAGLATLPSWSEFTSEPHEACLKSSVVNSLLHGFVPRSCVHEDHRQPSRCQEQVAERHDRHMGISTSKASSAMVNSTMSTGLLEVCVQPVDSSIDCKMKHGAPSRLSQCSRAQCSSHKDRCGGCGVLVWSDGCRRGGG